MERPPAGTLMIDAAQKNTAALNAEPIEFDLKTPMTGIAEILATTTTTIAHAGATPKATPTTEWETDLLIATPSPTIGMTLTPTTPIDRVTPTDTIVTTTTAVHAIQERIRGPQGKQPTATSSPGGRALTAEIPATPTYSAIAT